MTDYVSNMFINVFSADIERYNSMNVHKHERRIDSIFHLYKQPILVTTNSKIATCLF